MVEQIEMEELILFGIVAGLEYLNLPGVLLKNLNMQMLLTVKMHSIILHLVKITDLLRKKEKISSIIIYL